jgi:ferric-dicitrate binding protein FerR (iron transport regulator)
VVETIYGHGFAESAAARRELQENSRVFVRDLVGTGVNSRLALRLGTRTQLKLGAEARIRLDNFIANAGGVLELQSGAMLFDGDSKQRSRSISVRSPFALIAVRGTRFFAGPSANVFGVFVARGRVDVTAAGRRVVVTEGMGTNIAKIGSPPTPPAAWGQARIQGALASVQWAQAESRALATVKTSIGALSPRNAIEPSERIQFGSSHAAAFGPMHIDDPNCLLAASRRAAVFIAVPWAV